MYRLDRPSMAVNDPRVSGGTAPNVTIRRFQMENTWDITTGELRPHIIGWVARVARGASGGKLKNLVLSCHGGPASLQLGEGFDARHLPLFSSWRGLIEKIWLPDCEVARITAGADGNMFCSGLAKVVRCYVVASTESQCEYPITYPLGMMTSFEGLVLSYGPGGDVTWSHRNPSLYMNSSGACVPVPN